MRSWKADSASASSIVLAKCAPGWSIRLRKLWTGKPPSDRLRPAFGRAAGDRQGGLTVGFGRASAASALGFSESAGGEIPSRLSLDVVGEDGGGTWARTRPGRR